MPTIKDSSSIEEVLQYIVACYGVAIYQEKQRLSNLIADLYTGEERLKRLYRRMVMEDAVSQQLYAISLKPIQEREGFYNRLVFQFKEANFYEEAFARQVLDVFLHGMNLLLVEPISIETTEEDGEWVDEYGVKYSADRKMLIRPQENLYEDYNVLDGTIVICDRAFGFCKNLREITLPSSVTSIGDEAFWGCRNLQEINIPSSITSIGDSVFYGCRNLQEINIPSSITSIGNRAFGSCSNLQEIILPSSITSIGDRAFGSCSNLQEINIPSSVTSIGNYAFSDCRNLHEINIPSSITSIGDSVFYDCRNLQEINIPSSITSIGDRAFGSCWNLQEINIPSSVTSIGDYAFSNCSNLQGINVADSNKVYRAIDGVLYTKDLKTIIRYPQGKEDNKFVIHSSVTSIGDYAFSNCSNLQGITLPSSVMSIGNGAFSSCWNLQEINIPSSVTSIGDGAFWGCSNLQEINVAESNEFYRAIEGVLYTKDLKAIICYPVGKKDANFVILSGVTSIGNNAFYNCNKLREITIPSSVTSIGRSAFSGCSNLRKITIPHGVTSIGDGAFSCCRNLREITLSPSVTNIEDNAFWGCENLQRINIPAGTLEKFKKLLPRWTDKLHEV